MKMLSCALLVLTLAGPVSAQERDTTFAPVDTITRTQEMVVAGLMGGAIGMFIGGAAGAGLEVTLTRDCHDFCGLGGAVLGGVVGETLGLAFGVHAGNQRRGSFAAAVVGPIAVTGSAILLSSLFGSRIPEEAGPVIVIAIPVAQLITAIAGERRAARAR